MATETQHRRYIQKHYHIIPARKIAASLGIKTSAVYRIASQLGLTRKKKEWSPSEIRVIRAHYIKKGAQWIVEYRLQNRTYDEVKHKARSLGLERTTYQRQALYDKACSFAEQQGGKCLSDFTEHKNNKSKLGWKCADKHEWTATAQNIAKGSWCPYCRKHTNEEIVRRVFEHVFKVDFPTCRPEWLRNPRTGAKLELDGYNNKLGIAFEYQGYQHFRKGHFHESKTALTDQKYRDRIKKLLCTKNDVALIRITYFDQSLPNRHKAKLIFEHICDLGIETARGVDRINFNRLFKSKFKRIKKYAEKMGGACLSSEYNGYHVKHQFRCAEGHEWEAAYSKVINGQWCPKCAGIEKLTIEEAQAIAKKRNGVCLSKRYKNAIALLHWKCNVCGNHWKANLNNVKSKGSWCPVCQKKAAASKRKLTIEEMQEIAKQRGGKCLSKKYTDARTKLVWQCSKGHKWKASPQKIKFGRWCPDCARVRVAASRRLSIADMQVLARKHGGKCLSKQYINSNTRLKWRCARGHVWEAPPARIQGRRWCSRCRQEDRSAAKALKALTDLRKIARDRGGVLLSKDYINSSTALQWKCHCGNVWSATPSKVRSRQWCPVCSKRKTAQARRTPISVWQRLAKQRGGRCLSKSYDEGNQKLRWRCSKEHEWEAVPSSVKAGSWCPYCAGRHRTIEYCQDLAKKNGGNCLSKKYVGADKKHKWRCALGHTWEATPNHIRHGTWCPDCAGTRKSNIKEMRRIARERGGKCLSDQYINANSKLTWQCDKGHVWDATPANIKYGKWCPDCSGTKRLTIEEMHEIAASRGGKCLSKKYVNATTKLKWQCDQGHTWEARPANIKSGRWCPKCGRNKHTR